MMFQYIFFDLDGTIIDSSEGIGKCFQYALASFGIKEDRENLRKVMGPPLRDSFKDFYGMTEEEIAKGIAAYRARYVEVGYKECSLFPGVLPCLKHLKEMGKILVIATSKPEDITLMILKHLGILSYFDQVVGSVDGVREKKEEVLREAFLRLSIGEEEKDRVILIGDRMYDIDGAKKLGIHSAGVSYGFASPGELLAHGADYLLQDLGEIDFIFEETYLHIQRNLNAIPKFSKKTSKENLLETLSLLGNPQETFRVVHVAGTNGKGSISYYTARVLTRAGVKTGLFLSPHLVSIRERMQIDGKMISKEEFVSIYQEVLQAVGRRIEEGGEHLSYFEFLFAMAALYFAKQKVEIAVLEVGLGGRLDATNVIKEPLVCAIASISFDHQQYLGDSLTAIAGEKAGILKPNVPVVYQANKDEVNAVIEKRAKELSCPMVPVCSRDYEIIGKTRDGLVFEPAGTAFMGYNFRLHTFAPYGVENARIVLSILEILARKLECWDLIDPDLVREVFMETVFPARMQEVSPNVFIDGGHNQDGILAFITAADQIISQRGKEPVVLLFAVVNDKDYKEMVAEICQKLSVDLVILTEVEGSRKLKLENLAREFSKDSGFTCLSYENSKQAYEEALKEKKDGILFVAGSLYLAGEVLGYIGGKND